MRKPLTLLFIVVATLMSLLNIATADTSAVLGPAAVSTPVAAASVAPVPDDVSVMATTLRNCDGRLEDFRWDGSSLLHRWQTSAGGPWSGWESLGGPLIYDIDASRNSDCRLEAFGVGANHEMYHIWQVTAGGAWQTGPWESLGGYLTSRPYSQRLADNRLEVCAWGPDGIYHCKAQTSPSQGPWTGWY